MDLFEQYELEFTHKLASARQRQNQLSSLSGERRKGAISDVERQVEELKEILNKMEKATRNANSKDQERQMQQKLRGLNVNLTKLQRDLQHTSLVTTTSYGGNTPSGQFYDDYQVRDLDHRGQLLDGTDKLKESTDRLHNAHRIAVESENIGTNVLTELVGQKKQLEGIKGDLDGIDDNMTRSRKILSSMTRRIATNKMILAFIIVILFAANGLIIYFKWIAPLVKKAGGQ